MKSLSHVRLLATPWTAAHQAPPSMGFSRQEYWSGVPLPSPPSITGDTQLLCHTGLMLSSFSPPTLWDPMDCNSPRSSVCGDSPGKNTGVGCHCLLQCMKVKSESEVAQSCPTLSDPMDHGPPGSSVHGIFQARVLEWGAIAFSIFSSRSRLCPPSPFSSIPNSVNLFGYSGLWRTPREVITG